MHDLKPAQHSSDCFFNRINGNLLLVASFSFELDSSVYECIQRIILADANIGTGMDTSASLTIQDIAGLNDLTVRTLCAKALRFRITAVLGGTDTLLMCEQLKIHS